MEPLLAVPVTDFSALRFPLLLSPKIDGVRGWHPAPVAPELGFCSRKLKRFPDDCPDGPRYKALGNSMAVPVMRWIGARIQKEASR